MLRLVESGERGPRTWCEVSCSAQPQIIEQPQESQPKMLAKSIMENCLAVLPSRVGRNCSLVLAYHNVVSDTDTGKGDSSLHLSEARFEAQLKALRSEADVVSLPELFSLLGKPGRRAAVTFDDAYRGCITRGLGLCASAGIRPTVFVAPGLLGMYTPWDLRAQAGHWSDAERQQYLVQERGYAVTSVTESSLPGDYRIATLEELEAVPAGTVHWGNHSWNHSNLSVLSAEELRGELGQTQAFLIEHWPEASIPVVAYPYGLAPEELGVLAACRLRSGLMVTGGWTEARGESYRFPRRNVPAGISDKRFRARLRGW